MTMKINRRNLIKSLAASSLPNATLGCSLFRGAVGYFTTIDAFKDILLAIARNAAYDGLKNLILRSFTGIPGNPYYSPTQDLLNAIKKANQNDRLIKMIASLMGEEEIIKCLRSDVRIWCQRNRSNRDINGFFVDIASDSSPLEGGLIIQVIDNKTGFPDFEFAMPGFYMGANSKFRQYFPITQDLPASSAGYKTIRLKSGPSGFEMKDQTVFMAPVSLELG